MAQAYQGAEAAQEFVALSMTREEALEGGRRAVAFTAGGIPEETAAMQARADE